MEQFPTCDINDKNWIEYVNQEEAFRYEFCSRNITYDRFICKGDYKLWSKVIRLISSVFINSDGTFRKEQNLGLQWNGNFVKFCNRVLSSLPHLVTKDTSSLEYTEKQLNYIKKTIQPFFSTHRFTESEPTQVTKERLLKVWFENKKKAIEIVKDDCLIIRKQPAVIDKKKTEQYYDKKYDKPRINLLDIFDEYPECNQTEIPDFEPEEVGTVLKSLPRGKRWGIDGVRYEDYKDNFESSKANLAMCFNINKRFKKLPRSLKHALLRRAPKKNYKENDLSTLRDISLLPTAYKIFAKCLVNRLLPIVVDTAVHFWQRAYIKE